LKAVVPFGEDEALTAFYCEKLKAAIPFPPRLAFLFEKRSFEQMAIQLGMNGTKCLPHVGGKDNHQHQQPQHPQQRTSF